MLGLNYTPYMKNILDDLYNPNLKFITIYKSSCVGATCSLIPSVIISDLIDNMPEQILRIKPTIERMKLI